MTSFALARTGPLVRLLAALVLPFLVASCGSGGVSGPPPVVDPARITILPDTAVLYSSIPTTFTISGGSGAYIVSSSNQSVIAVSGPIPRNTLTVIPTNVLTDTNVTITVRDTGTTPVATALLTVRPGTVSNDITVTPSAAQGGNCSPAVCSGGDAVVSATISQGGSPLPARGVRLEVVSGEFRFITSQPGAVEVLEASTVVVSDQAGSIVARIRALAGAANQTAVLQITELGTLAFRRATFQIAQSTGTTPGFFTIPDTVTFSGPNNLGCAVGARADVSIFGGTPPYTVGNAGSAFSVSQSFVSASGGSFYIVANGACADNVQIPVVDLAGRTLAVSASNVVGTLAIPALLAAPDAVTLGDCNTDAIVSIAGGTGNFTVSNGNTALVVSPNASARTVTIRRAANSIASTPLSVGVASGDKTATITVNLTGDALTTRCEPNIINLTPPAVILSSCAEVLVRVSGGNPPYSVFSNDSSVGVSGGVATSPGNFSVGRRRGSPGFTPPASVTVVDNIGVVRTLPIDGTGTGPGSGVGACPP